MCAYVDFMAEVFTSRMLDAQRAAFAQNIKELRGQRDMLLMKQFMSSSTSSSNTMITRRLKSGYLLVRTLAHAAESGGGGGSSKKRGRDGLPVPSTPGDEEEDTKLNPVCAIASPLADGKLTKKALKVVKKGTTRVLFFFVQQRGERRRRFFFSALLAF